MLRKENPKSRMRHEFLKTSMEMGLSSHTEAELSECMRGKTEKEKEELAVKLLKIIKESKTEEEMIQKAEALNL